MIQGAQGRAYNPRGKAMKAIRTRFHGPTDTKGARVSASDADGNKVILSWDHALDGDDNHEAAAHNLCHKMGWPAVNRGGSFGRDMYWVF